MEKMELGANFKSWYHIVVTKENFFLVKLWKFHMSFSVLNNFFLKKWKLVNLEFPNEICQIGSLWVVSSNPDRDQKFFSSFFLHFFILDALCHFQFFGNAHLFGAQRSDLANLIWKLQIDQLSFFKKEIV